MNTFRVFLQILRKNIFVVIIYTGFLIGFGAFSVSANKTGLDFVAEKPSVAIINHDGENSTTENLREFVRQNMDLKEIDEDKIDDAIFYRDLSLVIFIPEHYHDAFLAGENPALQFKTNGDAGGAFAKILLEKYLKFAPLYRTDLAKLNEALSAESEVELTSQLDTGGFTKATEFYNFANYSLLGCLIYVICLVLASFRSPTTWRRIVVSSTNYRQINRALICASGLFALVLWAVYAVLSFVMIGAIMYSVQGLIYLVNSLVFVFCSTTLALFIGNLVTNKNATNGIVNVVALGSSFLCGAFVPMSWLPESILTVAHVLPSYYFVKNNELVAKIDDVNAETLQPILVNMAVIVAFAVVFVISANVVARLKRKRS